MLDPESLIPRACGAVDAGKMRAMPLAPVDGYILSRVDGMSSVGDLAAAMSMTVEDVIGSLIKLESLGLVQLPSGRKSSRPPRGRVEARPRSVSPPRGTRATRPTPRPAPAPRNLPPTSPSRSSSPAPGPRSTTPPAAKTRSAPPAATRWSSPPRSTVAPPRQETRPAKVSPPPASPPPPSPPPRGTPRLRSDPAPQSSTLKAPPTPAAPAPPPPVAAPTAAAPDTIDLPLEHQQRIATLFAQLDTIDHYSVLGIARGLEKKAIKRAYFELTARFHPDRFFRKKLGPFKAQMEAIFNRMTEAHDTLTDNAKREAYDAYIGSVEQTRSLERMVEETTAEMQRAEAAIGAGDSSTPPASSSIQIPSATGKLPTFDIPSEPPSSAPSFEFPKESPTAVSARLSSPDLRTLVDEAIVRDRPSGPRISISPGANTRRDVLARRLTGRNGSGQFKDPSLLGAPSVGPSKAEEAVGSLKRRYEDKVAAARTSQSRKYGDSAREALAKGNVVAAANAFRMALTFEPDNAELKEAHEGAQRAADQLLSDQYIKQADYEEKADKWADAARSWARVVRARPDDVKAHERAAFCLVKTNGNLHEAAALAQRAVQLSPSSAPIRLTLANVYLAAGLTLNAKRELEVAAQLAPNDDTITSLLKRIGKSD